MSYNNSTSLGRASIPGALQVSFDTINKHRLVHSHTPMQSLVQEAAIIAALWTGTHVIGQTAYNTCGLLYNVQHIRLTGKFWHY